MEVRILPGIPKGDTVRWKPYRPKEDEVRYQRRFAWWPKECTSGEGYNAEHTEMVWMEMYIQKERWESPKWFTRNVASWRYTMGEFTRRKLTSALMEPKPKDTNQYGMGQNQIQGYFSQQSALANNYQPLYPGQIVYVNDPTQGVVLVDTKR